MRKAVIIVGSIGVSLVLYCCPIITTIAAMSHWDDFVQWLLFIASSGELVTLCLWVYYFISESEDE